jgi:hypothetical protein
LAAMVGRQTETGAALAPVRPAGTRP